MINKRIWKKIINFWSLKWNNRRVYNNITCVSSYLKCLAFSNKWYISRHCRLNGYVTKSVNILLYLRIIQYIGLSRLKPRYYYYCIFVECEVCAHKSKAIIKVPLFTASHWTSNGILHDRRLSTPILSNICNVAIRTLTAAALYCKLRRWEICSVSGIARFKTSPTDVQLNFRFLYVCMWMTENIRQVCQLAYLINTALI